MTLRQQPRSPDGRALQWDREWFPLASNQREIWFHQALDPCSATYNIGGYLDCPVPWDPDRVQRAWSELVQRHDALRLEVRDGPYGTPEQRVLDRVGGDVPILDYRRHSDPESQAIAWMVHSMDHAVDLRRAPLFETSAILLSPERFLFFLKCHHVIVDGWTFSMLGRELAAIYTELGQGKLTTGQAPSYRSFVQSQQAYLGSGGLFRDLEFWRDVYPSPPARVLPNHGLQLSGQPACGKTVLTLKRPFYDQLERCTNNPSVTAFHAVLAALHAALAGFRPDAGLAIGLPILNRTGAQERRTAGLFVQAMPFWVEPDPDASHAEVLQRLAADLRNAYRHRRCPLGEINRAVGLLNGGREQMFDVTLSFERHDYEASIDGIPIRAVPLTNSMTPLPLSMFVREFHRSADVVVEFIYRRDCLSPEMARWLKHRFRSHLETFVTNPHGRPADLALLCEDERRLLREWNATEVDLARNRTVMDVFETMAECHADRVAVTAGPGAQWTYETLNRRANQIARVLSSTTSDPGGIVGVRMERGPELVAVMLAILKAGRVYLPMGVEPGRDRLAGIIEDAGVKLVLTSLEADPIRDLDSVRILELDAIRAAADGLCAENPPGRCGPSAPAYCIFTSGSTGRPKGVLLRHDGLANVVLDLIRIHRLTPASRVLQFAATTFDASIIELLGTLCAGGSVQIPPADQVLVPDSALIRFLKDRQITHAILPPAVLSILPKSALPDLQVLVSAGDACTSGIVDFWANGRLLINGYGPTECTVCATTAECLPGDPHPPIGRPIANTKIHIVDPAGREVPVGAAGEIAISGVGVGAGYLNRPGLERQAFGELPGLGRVYRTGDLGRWRPDGQLDHLGRMDRQAKIRGSRVDPVEVEAAIRAHPEVRDAVVVACGEAPHQWLAAYLAPPTAVEEIRHHLSDRLPRYMMPSRFVCLQELPRTAHGKVDFSALPSPVHARGEAKPTPPRDSLDQRLQNLWSKALGIENPGIDDDFFLLGGDSLKAAFLANEIETELAVSIPMAVLLDEPTIRNVADQLRSAAEGRIIEWPMILPLRPRGGQVPFFCFPGANASGFYLQALASELSEEIPFYAFQWQGLQPGTHPLETVDELAALYVAEIGRVCSCGPYRVGGHSIGGVIAFEVARRLEMAGQEVEHVIIFDTTLADPDDRPPGEGLQEASFLADMLKVCGWEPSRAGAFPVTPSGKLVDGPEVLSFMRRFLVAQSLLPYNCSDDQLRRVVAIWRAVAAAHDTYRPDGPVQAPITLFLAQDIPVDVPRKEQRSQGWGWDAWTKGGLNIEWVDGNHVQILSPPHVVQVAERLNRILAGRPCVQATATTV